MAIEPLSWRVAQSLIECLCQELAANAIADPTVPMPIRCCLRAGVDIPMEITVDGLVAIDQCCAGEAYVKMVTEYPSTVFFEPDTAATNTPCQLRRMALQLEMGVLRCISIDADCDENSDKMRIMAADKEAMYRAVCCWQKGFKNIAGLGRGTKWFAGEWEQTGPEGGCLLGTIPVYVSLPGLGCC